MWANEWRRLGMHARVGPVMLPVMFLAAIKAALCDGYCPGGVLLRLQRVRFVELTPGALCRAAIQESFNQLPTYGRLPQQLDSSCPIESRQHSIRRLGTAARPARVAAAIG